MAMTSAMPTVQMSDRLSVSLKVLTRGHHLEVSSESRWDDLKGPSLVRPMIALLVL